MFLKCKIAFKGYWLPNTWIKMMSLIPTNLWYDFFSGMSSHVINFSWCYCLILEKKIVPWDHIALFNNQLNVYYSTTRFRHDGAMSFLVFRALEIVGFFFGGGGRGCFLVKTCVCIVAVWLVFHTLYSIYKPFQ